MKITVTMVNFMEDKSMLVESFTTSDYNTTNLIK